jgi:hypothetical protein
MFTTKRLHRLTDYKESSPEGLSMLDMLHLLRLNLITSWVLYFSPFSVPILLTGIQKQCQCKVSCSGTQYSIFFCEVVTHSESDQARRCLPSLTRLNAHNRSTPLYQQARLNAHTHSTPLYQQKINYFNCCLVTK